MQSYRKILLLLLLLGVFVLAACGGDDEEEEPVEEDVPAQVEDDEDVTETEEVEETEEPAETEEVEETAEVTEVAEAGTIVEEAVAGNFTILVAAVEEAGLVEALSGEEPLTVFAPTDDAFAALLEELDATQEELLAREDLADILLYHVVEGEVPESSVVELDGESVATLQGGEISISVTDDGVVLNDSVNVVTTDVDASNGIIHIVDAVLLPPAEEEAEPTEEAAGAAGADVEVTDEPTEVAMATEEMTPEATDEVALAEGAEDAAEEAGDAAVEITEEATVEVTMEPTEEMTPEATEEMMAEETEAPMEATEEAAADGDTITDIVVAAASAEEDAEFTALLAAIEVSGTVAELLSGEGPFTVFAPTDEAFGAFPENILEALLSSPISVQSTLSYHVVEGEIVAEDLLALLDENDGTLEVETLLGDSIVFTLDEDGNVLLNDEIMLVTTDIEASNGVVHVIDGVLLPASMPIDPGAMGGEATAEATEEMMAEETEAPMEATEEAAADGDTITDIVVAAASAEEDAEFTALLAAIEVSGTVAELLSGEGPFTVFAPTDEAFGAFPENILEALLSSPISVQSTLSYHVVEGEIVAEDLLALLDENDGTLEVETLLGDSIVFTLDEDGNVLLNDEIMLVTTDIEASNGVVHVIDGVLLPASMPIDPGAMGGEATAEATEEMMAEETEAPMEATEEAAMGDDEMMLDALVNVMTDDELGEYLVAQDGMTLYMFVPDDANCTGECLEAWPPLTVESEDELSLAEDVPGELSIYEREDGTMQVAYNEMPLYFFINDEAVGDTVGQGVNDVWFVVAPTDVEMMEATEEAAAPADDEMVAEATEEAMAEMTEEPMEEEAIGMDMAGSITSVCLVTDQGGIDDGNFNELANNGMERAAEDFGLETTVIESAAASDYDPNISACIEGGFDAVITVGFLLTDDTLAAAQANPDVFFIGIDQFFTDHPENLVGVQYREDQAGFLVGVMAARMTESGTVAGVYGIDIPAVVKFRNGFEQGVAYADPSVEVLGSYSDRFDDPAGGALIAEQFLGEGADVIFGAGGQTGTGGIQSAATQDALVIGVDQDEYFTNFGAGESPGAENLITSALKSVDVGVYDMLDALTEGNELWLGGGIYILEASNGGIGFAPSHDADVPQEVIDEVDMVFEMLATGELDTGVDPLTGELVEGDDDMAPEESEMPLDEEATEEPMMDEEATEEPEATEEG